MTERQKTVTDHIMAAMTILDRQDGNDISFDDATRAFDELGKALELIQLVRCDAAAALDRF